MTLITEKDFKICKFCGKKVQNLGMHIANIHPSIMNQLDESIEVSSAIVPSSAAEMQYPQRRTGSINDMIRDKLDTMLNIKIIEMLSQNPNVSMQDLNSILNPPKPTSLQELKEFHDIVYGENTIEKTAEIDTGNQWANVALQALPIVSSMLASKKQEIKKPESDLNVRARESATAAVLKPIQSKTSGDSGKSTGPIQESRTPSAPGQSVIGSIAAYNATK